MAQDASDELHRFFGPDGLDCRRTEISGRCHRNRRLGAGYSSFSGLRDLPFAELKLHRSFVKNCAVDVTNAAICETAIDLADQFGSTAVAGGILQALMVMGCDFGKGMLVAPPMPKEQFLDVVATYEQAAFAASLSKARNRSSNVSKIFTIGNNFAVPAFPDPGGNKGG